MPHIGPGNFFEHQDVAKRWSLLFGCAFTLIMFITMAVIYLVISLVYYISASRFLKGFILTEFNLIPALITGAILLLFLGASVKKIKEIMDGGSTFAASLLGGKPLGRDLLLEGAAREREKQLKNIVAEMALAAGIVEPDIYILPLERGINALATGLEPDDAAIVVTWGALKYLNRDEMTGLIAHEFSHIVNGDMRHNTIMAGWLHGLFFVGNLGRSSLESAGAVGLGHSSGGAGLASLALLALGSISGFLGKILQAAFNRQREYLADASAVQFTRDPLGLAGVLKKIGGLSYGSRIKAKEMPDFRHFFIAQPDRLNLFSSHPPLAERITALDPAWNGEYYDFAAHPVHM